jgi:CDP-diacylglycerol--serine O-phosphatidyltransferase
MKKHIPNIFTLLNLVAGCLAIVMTLQNGIVIHTNEDGGQFIDIPEKIWMASFFIGMAALVDFLDGFVARLFKAASALGRELDSLADVVSFGVAPSMILYQFLRMAFAKEAFAIDISLFWLAPAFLPAAAAAYRLARFNLYGSGRSWFSGLPTPAAGILIASFPLIYWNTESTQVISLLTGKVFLYVFILIISWMMVSSLPIMSMKFSAGSKDNPARFILIAVTIIAAILFQWLAVPLAFLVYIFLSLIYKKHAS